MRKTATILYLIYIAMTIINILLLLLGGMHWLEPSAPPVPADSASRTIP